MTDFTPANIDLSVTPAADPNAVVPAQETIEAASGNDTAPEVALTDEQQALQAIPESSPFAQFQDIRDKVFAAGKAEEMVALDAKYNAGEELTDADLQLIVDHSNHSVPDIKAFLGLARENQELQSKAVELDQQKADAFSSELDALAGEGGLDGLKAFLTGAASESQKALWNAAFRQAQVAKDGKPDLELYRHIVQEQAAFRTTKTPPVPTQGAPSKPADLSLLSKANQQPGTLPPATPSPQAGPVIREGNPLKDATPQQIAIILQNRDRDPLYKDAQEVARAKYNYLAID